MHHAAVLAESNGMADSFFKSCKRDYVDFADLWTAADVPRDLQAWFATTTTCALTRHFESFRLLNSDRSNWHPVGREQLHVVWAW